MVDSDSSWEYTDAEQEKAMREEVTKYNCGEKLRLVQKVASLSRRELARILGVSEATIRRLESTECLPTDAFMNRLQALCVIGKSRFERMSEAEREKISGVVGAGGGVVAGIGAGIGAVAVAGEVAGLSAAGITSGLAAIGGGAMLSGIAVIAAIPVGTGLLGYGLVKGIKAILKANKLNSEEVNGHWEIRKDGPDDGRNGVLAKV